MASDRGRSRLRPSFDLAAASLRVRDSLPAVVQISVAALAAFAIAHFGLGHEIPFLAVTVCISSLSLARDARPRRVLDTALGITFGVLLADLSLHVFGRGLWQMVVVLATVLLLARFVHRSPGFAISAGIQASLVQLIPVASGSEWTRPVDAAIGAIVALLAVALVPRDARRLARGDERALLERLEHGVDALEDALRTGDQDEALTALELLRGTEPILADWEVSLESAAAIAQVSPILRGHRDDIAAQRERRTSLDYAVRNARVVARRVWQLLGDGQPRPELADTFAEIEFGIAELRASVDDPAMRMRARQSLTLAIVRLDPESPSLAAADIQDQTVFMQCRPLVVDLLTATGLEVEEARASLPDAD